LDAKIACVCAKFYIFEQNPHFSVKSPRFGCKNRLYICKNSLIFIQNPNFFSKSPKSGCETHLCTCKIPEFLQKIPHFSIKSHKFGRENPLCMQNSVIFIELPFFCNIAQIWKQKSPEFGQNFTIFIQNLHFSQKSPKSACENHPGTCKIPEFL